MTLLLPNWNDTQFTYNNKTLPNMTVILPIVLKTELERIRKMSDSRITSPTGGQTSGRTGDIIKNLINKFIIIEINKTNK
jgi:hypothetical protein